MFQSNDSFQLRTLIRGKLHSHSKIAFPPPSRSAKRKFELCKTHFRETGKILSNFHSQCKQFVEFQASGAMVSAGSFKNRGKSCESANESMQKFVYSVVMQFSAITTTRNYGKGGQHRTTTLNDMPVPEGDFFALHNARQRKHNLILATGVGSLSFAIFLVSDSLNLLSLLRRAQIFFPF